MLKNLNLQTIDFLLFNYILVFRIIFDVLRLEMGSAYTNVVTNTSKTFLT